MIPGATAMVGRSLVVVGRPSVVECYLLKVARKGDHGRKKSGGPDGSIARRSIA